MKKPFILMALIFVSLFFMFTVNPVLAVDDGYLRTLEGEAEASAHVADNLNKTTPAKEQLALENFLQNEKPTTYKYYKKLNAADKTTIVNYYHSDHSDETIKVELLRKKILDHYFKR